MRENEQENTDFIYYGTTELYGIHTKRQLVLHDPSPTFEELPIVTSKNVFPEYYMIYVEKFQDMINEDIDEWIYFFKHAEIKEDFKSPGILLVAKKLDYIMMNNKEKLAYENYLEYLGFELGVVDNAKFEGREEGREEGLSDAMILVATRLLKVNEPIEKIQMITDLSVDTIRELARSLGCSRN